MEWTIVRLADGHLAWISHEAVRVTGSNSYTVTVTTGSNCYNRESRSEPQADRIGSFAIWRRSIFMSNTVMSVVWIDLLKNEILNLQFDYRKNVKIKKKIIKMQKIWYGNSKIPDFEYWEILDGHICFLLAQICCCCAASIINYLGRKFWGVQSTSENV